MIAKLPPINRKTETTEEIVERVRQRYSSFEYRTAMNRLKKVRLKRILLYSGDDPKKQERSIRTLSRLLGYYVDEPHAEVIRHQNATQFGDRSRDLTLAFRGMGKSTVGNVTRAIAYILRDFNVRIGETSDTGTAARAFKDEIAAHLTYNEILIELFGTFFTPNPRTRFGRDSGDEATILQRTNRTLKEATITAIGVGGQSAGRHFEVIFADDLVTLDASRTPTQRKNLSDWHGSTLMGTKLPHTKIHYIGTRYYKDDLWEELEHGKPDQRATGGPLKGGTLRIPMVIIEAGQWVKAVFERLYPLNVCREFLADMGRYHFFAQMQQSTEMAEGLVFDYADFQWWAPDDNAPPKGAAVFNFSDLTSKKTEVGDFHATVTIAVARDRDGKFSAWVLDLVHKRCGMSDQRKAIWNAFKKWRPVQHGIEAVAMQAGFAEEIQERTSLPFVPCEVEKDKVYRARRIAPMVETHRVYFPAPHTVAGQLCNPLVEELTRFDGDPRNHDDTVDAFVGAATLATLGDWYLNLAEGMLGEEMESMGL